MLLIWIIFPMVAVVMGMMVSTSLSRRLALYIANATSMLPTLCDRDWECWRGWDGCLSGSSGHLSATGRGAGVVLVKREDMLAEALAVVWPFWRWRRVR